MLPAPRRIGIFGAGALGGAIAARFALSDLPELQITCIARGAHLAAIQAHGLRFWDANSNAAQPVKLNVTGDAADAGPQDLVITALKGHQLAAAAQNIAAMLGPETRVVMVLNGIPWWYAHGAPADAAIATAIAGLDPGGELEKWIGARRVLGCIAYHAAEVLVPGEIRLNNEGRFILGEPSGVMSPDLQAARRLFERAGWRVTQSARIRDDIWQKLLGNAAFNPLSALTRGSLGEMLDDPATAAIIERIMIEVRTVGEALGARFETSVAERMAQARRTGAVRSSMLQDFAAGRELEIDPLLGVVSRLGVAKNIATPVLDLVLVLVRQLDKNARRAK